MNNKESVVCGLWSPQYFLDRYLYPMKLSFFIKSQLFIVSLLWTDIIDVDFHHFLSANIS